MAKSSAVSSSLADFTRKMQLGQQAEVLLGSSAVNMGYGSTINLKGSEVLGTVSTQIAVKSLVAKGETVDDALATMNPVSFYTRQWYNPTNNFSYFLVYGFVAATVQQVLILFLRQSPSFGRRKAVIWLKCKAFPKVPHCRCL